MKKHFIILLVIVEETHGAIASLRLVGMLFLPMFGRLQESLEREHQQNPRDGFKVPTSHDLPRSFEKMRGAFSDCKKAVLAAG